MTINDDIACIILAAGASSRFGSNKLNAQLNDGSTLLQATLAKYQAVFEKIVVVIRPQSDCHEQLKSPDIAVVESPNAYQGMSQSLIAGVQASADSSSWLIALADMPYVQISTLKKLQDLSNPTTIVVPCHQTQHGNPVVFGKTYYSQLTAITGDKGAKSVVARAMAADNEKVNLVHVDDPGVLHDIDTPDKII